MLRLARIVLATLIVLAWPAWAGNVALVLGDDSSVQSDFARAFEESLAGSAWQLVSPPQAEAARTPPDLIVTVGSEALRKTLSGGHNLPILATLLPRQSYEKIVSEVRRPAGRTSAIYLDQPLARQAAFLQHLLPGQKRFGLLLSDETRAQLGAYRQALATHGLSLDSEDSDNDATLLPALNTLLGRVGALLAQPDGSIYRRQNIKGILITAFRHQKPVIGYSPALVNAGALAALYSTPTQIARQAAEVIMSQGSNLPPPSAPSQFAIAINPTVAHALNLPVPDEPTIRRALLADREAR